MEIKKRKHPVCMIRGCDHLQAASMVLSPEVLNKEGCAEMDTSPIEVKVCIKHARFINKGGYEDVSLSTRGRS